MHGQQSCLAKMNSMLQPDSAQVPHGEGRLGELATDNHNQVHNRTHCNLVKVKLVLEAVGRVLTRIITCWPVCVRICENRRVSLSLL